MKIIFVVDDSPTNLAAARQALEDTYKVYAIPSADRLFKLLDKIVPDLILLDINMPDMDGFGALAALKSNEQFKSVPVIFLTARNDADTEIRGFENGALDFIHKPFSAPVLVRRIQSAIEIDKLIKDGQQALRYIHNATISVISDLVENRDTVTGGHIERTQAYLEILIDGLLRAGEYTNEILGWDLGILLPSAQLHDVGKIVVSDLILNKPASLNDEEFAVIKKHCAEGERIIEDIISKSKNDEFLFHAKRFAGYHHEKWNGEGYPRGLSGEKIPLEGRIMAVADVYDALVSERPYKNAYTHEQAIEIIRCDSHTHFDPKVVDAFLNSAHDFERAFTKLCG